MKPYLISITVAFVFLSVSFGYALDASEVTARQFFNKYVELSDSFDSGVADLYSESATIKAYRVYPHGLQREMQLDGKTMEGINYQSNAFSKTEGR